MRNHCLRTLVEPEAFGFVEHAGIRCPKRLYARDAAEAARLDVSVLGTTRVVVKAVSSELAHKSEAGAVAIVDSTPDSVNATIRGMERRLEGVSLAGFSIAEFVAYDPSPGGEWLLGLRWTDEFGPVVSIGPGGVAAEFLTAGIEAGRNLAVFLPARLDRGTIDAALDRLLLTPLATGRIRRQPARTTMTHLREAIEKFASIASACRPDGLVELEINPLVAVGGDLVALDALAVMGSREVPVAAPRPIHKLRHLLTPKSMAIVGVSSGSNPGRVILNNVIREGFDRESIFVVKPGASEIDGCRAVPSIAALPQPVDLAVLSIPAAHVPEALIDVIDGWKAESVIVIPGGLEEKSGTDALLADMHEALRASRTTAWLGPVINGGNCLGVQSQPGCYDTMFLPPHKMGLSDAAPSGLAIVSQSGAFAASRLTRLSGIRPRYCVTVGNQMDLTIGDYLTFLADDHEVTVFGVYVEGLKPLDGVAVFDAIRRLTSRGVPVVLYRAGRTAAGAQATASHTAAVAGDYTVTRELAQAAGAVVAETLDDFTELLSLFTQLHACPVYGRRVGAVSNAGFECVAMADNLGDLELSAFTDRTRARLASLFEASRLSNVVDVHNPLDVTPMTGDAGFETAVRHILDDEEVDAAVVGCVPPTPALNTLLPGAAHGEDLLREDSVAQRLIRLRAASTKPWVCVVDAGPLYDPLARTLSRGGIPVFRSADRALRLLNVFVTQRLADTVRAQIERWVDAYELTPSTSKDQLPTSNG